MSKNHSDRPWLNGSTSPFLHTRQESSSGRRWVWYQVYAWACPLVFGGVSLIMEFAPSISSCYIKPNFGTYSCFFSCECRFGRLPQWSSILLHSPSCLLCHVYFHVFLILFLSFINFPCTLVVKFFWFRITCFFVFFPFYLSLFLFLAFFVEIIITNLS